MVRNTNGIFIPSEKYSYYVSSSANEVEFNFSTGSIGSASSTTLGYELSGSDEFWIILTIIGLLFLYK